MGKVTLGQTIATEGRFEEMVIMSSGFAFASGFVPGNKFLVGIGEAVVDGVFDYSINK